MYQIGRLTVALQQGRYYLSLIYLCLHVLYDIASMISDVPPQFYGPFNSSRLEIEIDLFYIGVVPVEISTANTELLFLKNLTCCSAHHLAKM